MDMKIQLSCLPWCTTGVFYFWCLLTVIVRMVKFSVALRPQRPQRLLGTGPGRSPRLSHRSWTLLRGCTFDGVYVPCTALATRCQVRVTVAGSGLCCICVTSFALQLLPLNMFIIIFIYFYKKITAGQISTLFDLWILDVGYTECTVLVKSGIRPPVPHI